MTAAAVLDLGQRLQRERARRFVGRAAEVELFAARLAVVAADGPEQLDTDVPTGLFDPSDLFSVLWVHGPGGIGKSTLLGAYAETARNAGFTVAQVDGGRIRPTPAGIRAAVRSALAAAPASALRSNNVIMIDAAERLDAAEEWLREEFLPALPASTLVVVASRRPPAEPWRSDPGWRDLLRVVSLRNLVPEAVRALLEAERMPRALLAQIMALTHGHPLAVSLLIDAMHRSDTGSELPRTLGEFPDLVAALLQRLIDEAPSGHHRAALQVSAHAPVTTEPMLRAVLPDWDADEVSELWDWLRELTIMEDVQAGIRPHEVARDMLEADLQWRDPDAYADIHRRVRGHVVDQLRASAGNPEALQHAVADLLFFVRGHPVAGVGWDWDAFGEPPGECIQSAQAAQILAMTRTAQGNRQAELVGHWLRRQTGGIPAVPRFRGRGGRLRRPPFSPSGPVGRHSGGPGRCGVVALCARAPPSASWRAGLGLALPSRPRS